MLLIRRPGASRSREYPLLVRGFRAHWPQDRYLPRHCDTTTSNGVLILFCGVSHKNKRGVWCYAGVRWVIFRLLAIVAALLWAMAASPVHAQQICGWRADLATYLSRVYAEAPVGRGLTEKGTLMEIFAARNGSWTMVETLPNGISCLRGSGDSWSNLPLITREMAPGDETS